MRLPVALQEAAKAKARGVPTTRYVRMCWRWMWRGRVGGAIVLAIAYGELYIHEGYIWSVGGGGSDVPVSFEPVAGGAVAEVRGVLGCGA